MVKDNSISTIVDDKTYRKFREYWIDRENITQERVSASAVARELIEYALDSMNGKKNIEGESMTWETRPNKDAKPDKVPDAKEDTSKNLFSDIEV